MLMMQGSSHVAKDAGDPEKILDMGPAAFGIAAFFWPFRRAAGAPGAPQRGCGPKGHIDFVFPFFFGAPGGRASPEWLADVAWMYFEKPV